MNEPIKTIEYKNYHIDIFNDPDPENPREWDNIGTMYCFHRRYNLGDKHEYHTHEEVDELANSVETFALPLYLYDHSGITMNTTGFSCSWDSGQVGWIIVTKEKALKEWNRLRMNNKLIESVMNCLKDEVKIYDDYLTGNVYGYQIRETGDGCWSFFGDDFEMNGLLDYAEGEIEADLDREHPLFKAMGVAI